MDSRFRENEYIRTMKNIVIIGGGTGTLTLLSGLREYPTNNAVIVSSADDGGSTGRLREQLSVMPPGDIRQCLVGLSYTDQLMRELFSYRFEKGDLKGHTVGNIFIAALEKCAGDIEKAIGYAAKILNVRGEVVPITRRPTILSVVLENGKKIVGEHFIDEPLHNGNLKIKSVKLTPNILANPRALHLIRDADAIVFGPGDLYTSTIPNLLVKGVVQAIQQSRAKKILITNLMTKWGQTNGFKASDFLEVLQTYLGSVCLDSVIMNNKIPNPKVLHYYKNEKSQFIEPDVATVKKMGVAVVASNLLSHNYYQKSSADALKRSYLRHDPKKLSKIIYNLVS